jgi:tetratricopeptide (TPR) repeat protein
MISKLIISVFFFTSAISFAQGVDISDYLKKIESGNKEEVKSVLPALKTKNPNDPNVLFLEGVLTENGQKSIAIFSKVADKYPQSRYADASLFRVYSFYYAMEQFNSASPYLDRLRKDYPSSPYIRIAEKNTPVIDENNMDRPAIDPLPPVNKYKKTDKSTDKKIDKSTDKKNYKFTIQAGAFSSSDNAGLLKKQFEDAGYESNIIEKSVAGTVFHVVLVGKFVTEKEAKDFLQNINSEYSLDGRVVKIN